VSFQKRTLADNVSIIFDARESENFDPRGYVFPNPYGSSDFPTGLDSFPAVLSYYPNVRCSNGYVVLVAGCRF